MKRLEIRYLIKKILQYSAKNIKANPPPPYSTLKPETNSDSPSEKSNGVRLVSASLETAQIIKSPEQVCQIHKVFCISEKEIKEKEEVRKTRLKKIKNIDTS